MGADRDDTRDGARPAVAYNPTANEPGHLDGDGLGMDDEYEILRSAGERRGGGARHRLPDLERGHGARFTRDGAAAAVAYNATVNEYLVSWTADGLAVGDELEVFGQRVSAAGTEVGTDFRISNVGTDNDAGRDAGGSAVAYNATANEYVVTWAGDGLATDNENEVFGQRVSAAGARGRHDDFRISNVGTDGVTSRGAPSQVDFVSAVAYNATANRPDRLAGRRPGHGQRVRGLRRG